MRDLREELVKCAGVSRMPGKLGKNDDRESFTCI